jgi:hypothetical protein
MNSKLKSNPTIELTVPPLIHYNDDDLLTEEIEEEQEITDVFDSEDIVTNEFGSSVTINRAPYLVMEYLVSLRLSSQIQVRYFKKKDLFRALVALPVNAPLESHVFEGIDRTKRFTLI